MGRNAEDPSPVGGVNSRRVGPENEPTRIYLERQSKQLCALHALNNLFQDSKAFTKQSLDDICRELAPDARIFNPHGSMFGLGCYDVNVIMSALSKKGFSVIWFDKRKDFNSLNFGNVFGLILNIPSIPMVPLNYIPLQFWSSQKHWVAIKKIRSFYYLLDSKLTSPRCLGDEAELIEYLRGHRDDTEVLVVVSESVREDTIWNSS